MEERTEDLILQMLHCAAPALCISVMLSPFSRMRPVTEAPQKKMKVKMSNEPHVVVASTKEKGEKHEALPSEVRVPFFLYTSYASSKTKFMYSSNP